MPEIFHKKTKIGWQLAVPASSICLIWKANMMTVIEFHSEAYVCMYEIQYAFYIPMNMIRGFFDIL